MNGKVDQSSLQLHFNVFKYEQYMPCGSVNYIVKDDIIIQQVLVV